MPEFLKRRAKLFLCFLVCCLCFSAVSAQSSSSESRAVLQKAQSAYATGEIKNAFNLINQAMELSKGDSEDEQVSADIIPSAREIYKARLHLLEIKYLEKDFAEIQVKLDEFPEVLTPEITKLIRKIKINNPGNESLEAQILDRMDFQSEETQEMIQNQGNQIKNISQQISDTSRENAKGFRQFWIIFIIIGIVILAVVIVILIVERNTIKNAKMHEAQYAEAFRLLAQSQMQTNQLLVGGVPDLYSDDGLKLAGSSAASDRIESWTEEEADEKEELRELASKCEDLGAKIDQVTGRKNNSKNVSELVYKLSLKLGIGQRDSMIYFCAAMVYDAGFLGIDPELMTAENMTKSQRSVLNRHVDLAVDYLQFVPKRWWTVFENAARLHHENMDGSGMPEGLKGENIPEIARIIRVADSFNALASRRTYRGGTDKDSAVAKLEEQSGIYDPKVIQALKDII